MPSQEFHNRRKVLRTFVYALGGCLSAGCAPRSDRISVDAPKQILLATDDWHLEDFLELPDGRYLWVTGQGDRNRSFACSYWFNSSGEIVEHDIEEIKDQASRREVFDKHLKRLDGGESAELYVNLFTVSKFGYEFGLFRYPPRNSGIRTPLGA